MNEYSPVARSVRDGYPYTFEADGRRCVLSGIETIGKGEYKALYHDGVKQHTYTLPDIQAGELGGKIKVLAKHPSRPCVRVRYDAGINAWMVEVNHPTVYPKGWEEAMRFYCIRREGQPEDRPETFISGHVLEVLADYVKRGFLFVDM